MAPKSKRQRKIAIITGTRAEFSYYHPVIEEIKRRPNLDYGIIATNTHVLDSFGHTIDQIRKDDYKIDAAIYNTLDGYNRVTMAKSLSIFLLQLPELFEQMKADIILIAGDRGEQFMGAIAGAYLYLPVAHIQGGEISGNIDGVTRHAITKLSHIHFASNKDAADRIIRTGEEKKRVFLVGAPQLDDLVAGAATPSREIFKKFSLTKGGPNLLFVFHSVTEEYERMGKYMDNIMSVISRLGYRTVVITNNSDAGSAIIRKKIYEYQRPFMYITDNVSRADYAGLMSNVDVLVGNSSSGILEAPTFKLPVVNVGNREAGRMRGINVIDVGYGAADVSRGIKKALSPAFRATLKNCVNPYGDGHSAKRIVDVLERITINTDLLVKKLSY